METKESIRLKEIKSSLDKMNDVLKEENRQLKSIAKSLNELSEKIAAFKESRIIGMDISQEEQNELQ